MRVHVYKTIGVYGCSEGNKTVLLIPKEGVFSYRTDKEGVTLDYEFSPNPNSVEEIGSIIKPPILEIYHTQNLEISNDEIWRMISCHDIISNAKKNFEFHGRNLSDIVKKGGSE